MRPPAEFANQLILKNPNITLLPENSEGYPTLSRELQKVLHFSDAQGRLVLPDLRAFGNDSIAIFSDYGGENAEGRFYTYSTLICGFGYTGPFHEKMKRVRERHGLGEKEIAFKDFRMGPLRRALPDYLEELNNLPGFLCTLGVDKRVPTLFGPLEKSAKEQLARLLETEGLGVRKPDVAEKLLRVVHFTAFLTALLAHDRQKIFWMTDNDAICANQEAHKMLLSLFERVLLSVYARPNTTFPVIGGALPFAPRNIEMLDLLSAADVVAGSLEACFPTQGSAPEGDPLIKSGADDVLRWLAHDGVGLKKATVFIRSGAQGTIESGALVLGPTLAQR